VKLSDPGGARVRGGRHDGGQRGSIPRCGGRPARRARVPPGRPHAPPRRWSASSAN
jgi:hypothetical protein